MRQSAVALRWDQVAEVPQDPLSRIQNYLDRLDNIVNPSSLSESSHFDRKERNLEMLKNRLYNRFMVKPEDIPENYWENQRRIICERGQGGDLEQVDFEELKRQNTEAIIADQRSTLDKWVNYLTIPDSSAIPNSIKYFALRSVLNMGGYDKEKKAFTERTRGTVKPFPDLNREALHYVADALKKKYKKQTEEEKRAEQQSRTEEEAKLTPEEKEQRDFERQQFEKLLDSENFAKLYAFAIEKVTPASKEALANTAGLWMKYNQGSDHMPLALSLQGHGTGWCTAAESTAETQLKGGDFYVYYSMDAYGKPTIPRVAIRMGQNRIAEVRGIAADQNLDAEMISTADEKLKEFPDGDLYKKRVHDMEFLTAIDHKIQERQTLTSPELSFLYEVDATIEGFGYERDPRIKEVRAQRNPDEDMPIVFGCDKSQIARSPSQIRPDTKAYVGSLAPGIFDTLQHVEHVYTSFPEGKIRRQVVEIGGKAKKQLQAELKQAGINVSSYTEDMLKSSDFTTLSKPQNFDTVRLKVEDLGLSGFPTTDQVYKRAEELGLELCPAEVGPHYRLKYADQPLGEWFYIGMKQIADRDGDPLVFRLVRDVDGLWLDYTWAEPGRKWHPKDEFVFGLRKKTQNPQSLGFFDRVFKH